jgi:sugar lactone lactonase YvrE
MYRKSYILLFLSLLLLIFCFSCKQAESERKPWSRVATVTGFNREFGEPFGLAFDGKNVLYVSDGEKGAVFRLSADGKTELVTDRLDTPSQIAFDNEGFLIVADSGTHSIKKIDVTNGSVETIAGVDGKKGFQDGEANAALFNAPIGVAVRENKIFVADTYNDKIRVIENGRVSTLTGSEQGFADSENGEGAKFDTPCGIAVAKDGNLIVADTGNRRIRRVEPDGKTTTIAGGGEQSLFDGMPFESKFIEPTSVIIDDFGVIYAADGNSIRAIGRRFVPLVETITNPRRGFSDGNFPDTRFNRPSGLAFDPNGNLFVADSDNQTIRVFSGGNLGAEITPEQLKKLRFAPEEFRGLQPARWTYNPPDAARDVAGTLGEIRGEITEGRGAWFHNGFDIAGAYGETARFIRTEKVLKPLAAEYLATSRELIRMPTIGYIHIRLGRDSGDKPFGDERFQFGYDDAGKIKSLRVARGTRFKAGEAIGTLNSQNHVHLIAGRAGAEMNALDALVFPNIKDTIAPKIEKVAFFDENWHEIETERPNQRIKLNGKTRVVVRAFDQMNGNAGYRKLGVYKLGYQILKEDKTPLFEPKCTISFARLPAESAVPLVYAPGSQSGSQPPTIFDYIVTNEVYDEIARENFLDAGSLEAGNYILRVFAADFFGNNTERDLDIEIVR